MGGARELLPVIAGSEKAAINIQRLAFGVRLVFGWCSVLSTVERASAEGQKKSLSTQGLTVGEIRKWQRHSRAPTLSWFRSQFRLGTRYLSKLVRRPEPDFPLL
jgi:hypothetical protein